jgi:type I site-specific restriction endonuclease
MTDTLRPYQTTVVAEIKRAIDAGDQKILLIAPTGSVHLTFNAPMAGKFCASSFSQFS